jgi:penicillin-binding protein-related factor A (putative recombinase)
MLESNFQSLFSKWVKDNWRSSAAFELKITKTNTLPFSRIEEHQLVSLSKAKHAILYHKISDSAIGFKPFDCFTLYNSEAYLVIMYYKPRAKKQFYMIDIDVLENFMQIKSNHSISEQNAKELGQVYYL